MQTATSKKPVQLSHVPEYKRSSLRHGHSMKALHVDNPIRSPAKFSIYNQPASNFMGLNKIFVKRKGSILKADSQVSEFYAQAVLNETKAPGKLSLRQMSLRRETAEAEVIHSEKFLGDFTKQKMVEGFEDQKHLLRTALKKPFETLKFRATDTGVMGKVPRKSNCIKSALKKMQGIDSCLLSQEDMTQSGIVIVDDKDKEKMRDKDKFSPRKMLTDNRDVRKKEVYRPRVQVSINNLLQLIKSDRKLAQNRKQIEVR